MGAPQQHHEKFTCPWCFRDFYSAERLCKEHIISEHVRRTCFYCDSCEEVLATCGALDSHRQTKHAAPMALY